MLDTNIKIVQAAADWATAKNGLAPDADIYCPTRDVFEARSTRLLKDLRVIVSEDLAFLLLAITQEIGNNSFDHNIGNWRDVPGVYFGIDMQNHVIVLADRGQGIRATIKKVRPEIQTDTKALTVAFTVVVSGRAPERRGNGLKFVKKIVLGNKLKLRLCSGDAEGVIDGASSNFQIGASILNIPGALCVINFSV